MRPFQFYPNQLLTNPILIGLGKLDPADVFSPKLTQYQRFLLKEHDKALGRNKYARSPYSDVQTNNIKQIELMENYSNKLVDKLDPFYSYLCKSYESGYIPAVHLYRGLVTTSNSRISVNPNGEVYVSDTDKKNAYRVFTNAISKLKKRLYRIKSNLRIIITGIQDKVNVYRRTFNVHAHLEIITVGDSVHLVAKNGYSNQYEAFLSQYFNEPVTFTIKDLINNKTGEAVRSDSGHVTSDINSINQFTRYILRQGRLPVVKTIGEAKEFTRLLTPAQLGVVITAILNSTKGITLHSHADFKRLAQTILKRYGHKPAVSPRPRNVNEATSTKFVRITVKNDDSGRVEILAYKLSLDQRRPSHRNRYTVSSVPANDDTRTDDVTVFNST